MHIAKYNIMGWTTKLDHLKIAQHIYCMVKKLSREKTLTNFAVLEPPAEVFFTKFGCVVPTYDRL